MNWIKRIFGKKVKEKQCAIDSVIHWVSMVDCRPSVHHKRYLVYGIDVGLHFQTWYQPHNTSIGWWGDNNAITHYAEIPKPPCV